ncbi:ribosomal-processing cysteine protease Prp [Spiroplasma taiwanense]|uniref:ribosomal-processing cysteine protease Prp n=1 Tax=Spiroplasma taiwanense TaxID=2145 RepID=UPI000404A0C7|nr:ribosomal-processing cysteine protease Prp [Spiroplasma taiwanense]
MAKIFKTNNEIISFNISGHAESNKFGEDLVCAAVTGIINGALNALDLKFGNNLELIVKKNEIVINVKENNNLIQELLEFLMIQLETISIQYPKNFKIEGMI